MGWFSRSDSTDPPPRKPAPALSADGTPVAPSRSERARCWEARDAYFACLDKHGGGGTQEEEGAREQQRCAVEARAFDANCAHSWVQYFKKRRVFEHNKAKTLERLAAEGAQEVPPGFGPIPPAGPR